MWQDQKRLMPIEAKILKMLLSLPVLAVKVQERGAAMSAGDQGVSQGVRGVTRASRGHCFMRHTLMLLHSQQQTICRVSKNQRRSLFSMRGIASSAGNFRFPRL